MRSGAVGAVFDDIVGFFRPTYSHVREERQRLELTREGVGDSAPPQPGGVQVRVTLPPGYTPPQGPRRRDPHADSRGLVV